MNYNNKATTDLNKESLEAALALFELMVSERGQRVVIQPTVMYISSRMESRILRRLKRQRWRDKKLKRNPVTGYAYKTPKL